MGTFIAAAGEGLLALADIATNTARKGEQNRWPIPQGTRPRLSSSRPSATLQLFPPKDLIDLQGDLRTGGADRV